PQTATPTPTSASPSPTPTPPASPAPIPPLAIVLSDANLRSGPGRIYPIIGAIAAGQKVFVRATNAAGDWMQLDMSGDAFVWIAAFLLDLPAGLQLPPATHIPPPPPTPTPGDTVRFTKTTISLPTYPWQAYLTPAYDEVAHWTYQAFDRQAYEAAHPQPSPQTYELLLLENNWLRLSMLPELGGRIYQMIFKPSGHNELYQNPVIKPSPWGPGEHGNGWIAAGGIEWDYPVSEHGYVGEDSWGYITRPNPPAYGLTLFDQGQERIHLSVDVSLSPDSAAFQLDFLLQNPTPLSLPLSYWTNAMIAPGAANSVGPDLYFIYPGRHIRIHSTGDAGLGSNNSILPWPVYNGRNLSRLGTWQQWLGFFMAPQAQANWAGIYDTDIDEGLLRIFPADQVPGLKGFGFGWSDAIDPHTYTDDSSTYVEMHGGLSPTFADSISMAPYTQRTWSETWYPVAGIGGISQANAGGAAHLQSQADGWHLRLFSTSSRSGTLSISDATGELMQAPLQIDPAHPADTLLPDIHPPLAFRFQPTHGIPWQMTGLQP
ncbi:MAG: DUF5107 domain-containing protein, partial [Chloroflexi bacterium]|nr:DUF5107 domain-containing protein [Chloroflexota bacterium]